MNGNGLIIVWALRAIFRSILVRRLENSVGESDAVAAIGHLYGKAPAHDAVPGLGELVDLYDITAVFGIRIYHP